MAYSDYDTLAVNEKGEPTNGVFESPLGVTVEIYKTWLYVRDPKAWQPGGAFVEPTVMQIRSGSLDYKDVKIEAIRGPQGGVYAVVSSRRYEDKKTGQAELFKAMVGIGCYGFEDHEWVGVTEESKQFLVKWLTGSTIHAMVGGGLSSLPTNSKRRSGRSRSTRPSGSTKGTCT